MIWTCPICEVFITITFKSLVRHLRVEHAADDTFNVKCMITNCNKQYKLFGSFYKHVIRNHKQEYHNIPLKEASPKHIAAEDERHYEHGDSIEDTYETSEAEHAANKIDDTGDNAVLNSDEAANAGYERCETGGKQGINPNSDEEGEQEMPEEQMNCTAIEHDNTSFMETTPLDMYDTSRYMDTITEDSDDEFAIDHDLAKDAAKFLFNMQEIHCMTQKSINAVSKGCSSLIENVSSSITQEMKKRIEGDSSIVEKDKILAHVNEVYMCRHNPFDDLLTSYKQKSFMHKYMHCIEPVQINLGRKAIVRTTGCESTIVEKDDAFFYIPIENSVQQFISNPLIFDMVKEEHKVCPEGFLTDVWDGKRLRPSIHHLQPSTKELHILFQIYYDDVEVCNPLGGCSHKLAMFYYRCLNINPLYRSMLPCVRLLAVCETKIMREYGIDRILAPLLESMKKLNDDGWPITVQGKEYLVHGYMHSVIADTPAANLMGGFKESVGGAYDKCRYCQCTFDKMQKDFLENDFVQATMAGYEHKCTQIENAKNMTKDLHDFFKTLYGINRRSILTQFPHFDIIECIPADIMHIMQEGVIPYEVKSVLKQYILEDSTFTMKDFNEEFIHFYSHIRADSQEKPNDLTLAMMHKTDNKLGQSSDKMLSLLRALPFMLFPLVEQGCRYYELLCDLLQVSNCIFSPVTSEISMEILKGRIHEHLTLFKELFPDLNILPKQHFMIHIPTITKNLGPSTRSSACSFESKNKVPKRKIIAKQNFKNVPYSVAVSSERAECMEAEMLNPYDHPLFANSLMIGKKILLNEEETAYFKHNLSAKYNINADVEQMRDISKSKMATFCGFHFICNYTFVVVACDDVQLQFAMLQKIYFINSKCPVLQVQRIKSLGIVKKLQACQLDGEVEECLKTIVFEEELADLPEGTSLIQPKDLVDYNAYYSVKLNDARYIPIFFDTTDLIDLYNDGYKKTHNLLYKRK